MRRRALLGAAVGVLAGGAFTRAGSSFAAERELQLRFNLDMNNSGPAALAMQRLWMYMPVRRNAWWTLRGIDLGLPHELQGDALGHAILFVPLDGLAAYARRSVSLTVTLQRTAAPMPAVQHAADWLAPERYIESNDDEITTRSRALKAATAQATVRNVYDFVASGMTYAGYLPEPFGALYALRERRGDCTEYAGLVVALCRASGIPARMVEGYVSERSFAPRSMDFHDWAEVLIEGHWRVVDAQKGAFLEQESHYLPFRYHRDTALNGVGLAHRYRVEGEMEFSV